MNNNVTLVPVTARPWTGISAAPLGASNLSGFALAQRAADFRAMAPSCAATGVLLLEHPLQAATPAMPGLGQQSTTVETYITRYRRCRQARQPNGFATSLGSGLERLAWIPSRPRTRTGSAAFVIVGPAVLSDP